MIYFESVCVSVILSRTNRGQYVVQYMCVCTYGSILKVLVCVCVVLCAGTSCLTQSLRESCAHMLAAIHLRLRDREGLLPAYNCTFQYLVEWSVAVYSDGAHTCMIHHIVTCNTQCIYSTKCKHLFVA